MLNESRKIVDVGYLLHRWREVKRAHLSRAEFLAEIPKHQHNIQHWLQD